MSGGAAAQALEARFEAIRQAEWARLSRKVASLDEAHRAQVAAIIAEVVGGLVAEPARALRDADEPRLTAAALRLFGVE